MSDTLRKQTIAAIVYLPTETAGNIQAVKADLKKRFPNARADETSNRFPDAVQALRDSAVISQQASTADRGPTEAQWLEMNKHSGKYRPLITRLAGFYVLHGAAENDEDFPLIGRTVHEAIPAFLDLSEDEAYFVHTGAVNVICRYGAFAAISGMAGAWLEDGAPE